MTKKIIVHLGMRKVASSSLQQWLKANKVELLKQGILYPELFGFDYNHNSLGKRLANVHDKNFSFILSEVLQDLSSQGPFDSLILSYEGFFLTAKSSIFFKELASELNATLNYVLLVRHPADYINSWYAQRVSTFTPLKPFTEQINDDLLKLPEIKYNEAFIAFEESCDNFIVIPLRHSENNFIDNVISALGISKNDNLMPNTAAVKNPSLSLGILEVYRHIAIRLKSDGYNKAIIHKHHKVLRNMIINACEKEYLGGDSFYGVTPEIAEHIDTFLKESNDAFAYKNWGKSWCDIFPDSNLPAKKAQIYDGNSSMMAAVNSVVVTLYPKIIKEIE